MQIIIYVVKLLLFIFIILIPVGSYADDCVDWFKENKVLPSNKSCLSKCVTLQADLARQFIQERVAKLSACIGLEGNRR